MFKNRMLIDDDTSTVSLSRLPNLLFFDEECCMLDMMLRNIAATSISSVLSIDYFVL